MPAADVFLDTNVILYALSADVAKADRAEALLRDVPCISVQVLNEVANVARRKLGWSWQRIRETEALLCTLCTVLPLTVHTHERALAVAERYGFSIYDAGVVAAAQIEGCSVLYSEDLQHGQIIDALRVVNPFLS